MNSLVRSLMDNPLLLLKSTSCRLRHVQVGAHDQLQGRPLKELQARGQSSGSTYVTGKQGEFYRADETLCRVANFRDVGLVVNQFLGERRIRERILYRSARPDEATTADKILIRDGMGIKTIIDLRTRTERLRQAERGKATAHMNGLVKPLATSRIHAVEYREINLAGRSLERHLLSLLTWWDFIKSIILYVLGYHMSVVKIISHRVMIPRGPISLGLATLDHSGAEICQALLLFTSPQNLPSLIHCTHGKDRSGLICALILMILGIPRPAIEHDYYLSDAGLVVNRDEILSEIGELDLPNEWSGTSKGMIEATERHLSERYGGLDGYLDQIGFDQRRRVKIREVLLLQ